MISKSGQVIRLNTKQIPSQGRATQGVYLMRLRPKDKVASISLIQNIEKEAEEVNSEKQQEPSSQTKIQETKELV